MGMKQSDYETLTCGDLEQVMKPLKRTRSYKNYIDIAWDTEYKITLGDLDEKGYREVIDSTLISMQFALDEERTAIYYPLNAGITWRELLEYTLRFLAAHNVTIPETASGRRHIWYITFYSLAELSQIVNYRDEATRIQFYGGKSNYAERSVKRDENSYVLHVLDLKGFFRRGGLADVAKLVSEQKLKINVDGRGDKYWKEHMLELYRTHADVFEEYALRDAIVTYKLWSKLKEENLKRGLDAHVYRTEAGLAAADFRLNYMTQYPCKYRVRRRIYARGSKKYTKREYVYDSSLDVRSLAILSYWGGRNEAYVRGLYDDIEAYFLDFVSLYPTSAIIQPLPNEETRWKTLTLEDAETCEGYCRVTFRFPVTEKYPCLPVRTKYFDKLMFPLEGVSYCTLAELRRALTLGCEILAYKGYGFEPTESEIAHDLKPYFRKLLRQKRALKDAGKKGIEYAIVKGRLNSTVGKFAYRSKKYSKQKAARVMQRIGEEQFRAIGQMSFVRQLAEQKGRVGSTWAPEWASLIVGCARAAADEIIHDSKAECLFISTDGGLWLRRPAFLRKPGPLLKKLIREAHGGVHGEGTESGQVDKLWIARNRFYATFYKDDVVKLARDGLHMSEAAFEGLMRESLRLGMDATERYRAVHLTKLFERDYIGMPLGSKKITDIRISFREGGKRVLANEGVNIWRAHTATRPYRNVEQAIKSWYNIKTYKKRKKLTKALRRKILAEPWSKSNQEIAATYGFSESYVAELRRVKVHGHP